MSKASERDIEIMRGAYRKLDGMSLSFGLPQYSEDMSDEDVEKYMYGDLKDTLRELRVLSCDNVPDMSLDEMNIENRTVYYALRRFRNSASVFFKFSTASDGKSVDKHMIPKMIMEMLAEYDTEFKKWRMSLPVGGGGLWSRESTVATDGDFN